MLDHVADLFGPQPVVDRDQHPAVAAYPEEGDLEAGRVRADDGHPFAEADAELVEAQGQAPGPGVELAVGERAQGARHARLVDDGRPVTERRDGPVQESRRSSTARTWQSPRVVASSPLKASPPGPYRPRNPTEERRGRYAGQSCAGAGSDDRPSAPASLTRVLVISASMGAGHDGAARELAARLRAAGHHAEVRDFLDSGPLRSARP